ncbi:MAG: hypothetical protein JNG90_10395, partial [Planctomycetaceae bacterium]|nr:hypothetical protein [Planctomycetaceae bacterium]
ARMSWCLGDAEKLQGDMGIKKRGSDEFDDTETKVIYPDFDPRGVNPVLPDAVPDAVPNADGPELLPPGALGPGEMPGPPYILPAPEPGANGAGLPGPQSARPTNGPLNRAPASGAPPVVAPVTNRLEPTRLPAVAGAPPRLHPGNTQRAAAQEPVHPRPGVPPAQPVSPATFVPQTAAPAAATKRPVVTGKYAPGNVIPGGASDYLIRPQTEQERAATARQRGQSH